jgi:hypothetical protein
MKKSELVFIKGEYKTDVREVQFDPEKQKYLVDFGNGKKYPYNKENCAIVSGKIIEVTDDSVVYVKGTKLEIYDSIYKFTFDDKDYFKVNFGDECIICTKKDFEIRKSVLLQKEAGKVFEYLKELSGLNELGENTSILQGHVKKITEVTRERLLSQYLTRNGSFDKNNKQQNLVFPFGCNNSQMEAVEKALSHSMSVIEGPPGTGKTQTILNIVANILTQGKTVLIVSNNNAAVENIKEKLASDKYKLDFFVAQLGSSDKKTEFASCQTGLYPDLDNWEIESDKYNALKEELSYLTATVKDTFDKKEHLSLLRQELSEVDLEWNHFKDSITLSGDLLWKKKIKRKMNSKKWLELWSAVEDSFTLSRIGFIFKIRALFKYGIIDWNFYENADLKLLDEVKSLFYRSRISELEEQISFLEKSLEKSGEEEQDRYTDVSMLLFKCYLQKKYKNKQSRRIFQKDELEKAKNIEKEFLREYPVVLSSTFSATIAIGKDALFDYVIMDEASQADIVTGALSLYCAKNAVIVGDTKQLPHVVTNNTRSKYEEIFNRYNIDEAYQYTNSFLASILKLFPDVPKTLLREHYRCHPKIINYCNKKFYNDQLIIMTKDNGEDNVLQVIKGVPGNHKRYGTSQRQIDIIKKEIIPLLYVDEEVVGIAAPYNGQTDQLNKQVDSYYSATVHKFQGREKDVMIVSTVDDEISDFVDAPSLVNVAVSRAVKRLILVVTGNEQTKRGNITDLVEYIQYNNFDVRESKIRSVFDYLYTQYSNELKEKLKDSRNDIEHNSEKLLDLLLTDILSREEFQSYTYKHQYSLRDLIPDNGDLSEDELRYARNENTHIDFLLYSKVSKKPILAIEVDGYEFHKEGTKQHERDKLKNSIFEKIGLPYLRLGTQESGEEERIISALNEIQTAYDASKFQEIKF